MKISLIAVLAKNNVLGYQNKMPWHLPADLKHFKQLTLHKPVIMGRNTFVSLGKPLSERRNIVITRNVKCKICGVEVVNSIAAALELVKDSTEVMIIGGAQIYQQTIAQADCLYLTFIDAEFTGDTFFPTIDKTQWQEVERYDFIPDEKNPYPYSFVTLLRKQKTED